MLRKTLLVLALALLPTAAQAQYYFNVQLTIDNTSGGVSFSSSDIVIGSGHPQVMSAFCVSNSSSGEFRYRVDGGAPTTTNGIPVPISGAFTITGTAALLNFKGIRTGSTSAVITCNFSDLFTPPTSLVGAGGGSSGGSVTQGTTPWIVAGGGTAGSAAAGVVTVQGIASGTAVTVAPTSGSFATDGTFDSAVPATGPSIGLRAESTTPSAMADGDLVYPWADLLGRLVTKTTDPCSDNSLKTTYVVDTATSGTIEFLNGAGSGNYIYICSVNLVTAGANNVTIGEDDTDNCGSVTAGLNGGVTAGEGWNFAANGGIALGGGGSWVLKSAGTNRYGCLLSSASVQLSGTIVYALAP